MPSPHRVREGASVIPEGMVLILCPLLHNHRRKPHPVAWREALPTGLTLLSFPVPGVPVTPTVVPSAVPSAQRALRRSPSFRDHHLRILSCWLTCHPLREALPSPRRAAVLSQVPMAPPHTVVICLGPSPPTGPRSILSIRLPRGARPLNTPRHVRDSGQRGSANEHPGWGLQRAGGLEEVRGFMSFVGSFAHSSISSFVSLPTHTCLSTWLSLSQVAPWLLSQLSGAPSTVSKKQTHYSPASDDTL